MRRKELWRRKKKKRERRSENCVRCKPRRMVAKNNGIIIIKNYYFWKFFGWTYSISSILRYSFLFSFCPLPLVLRRCSRAWWVSSHSLMRLRIIYSSCYPFSFFLLLSCSTRTTASVSMRLIFLTLTFSLHSNYLVWMIRLFHTPTVLAEHWAQTIYMQTNWTDRVES